ncbi:MAG: GTA-gp10 family protein [Pseudomonadota bacterium]
MSNPQRGETCLLIDDQSRRLRLTLGALAQMEEALGVDGFAALGARLRSLSAGDLVHILDALLAAGEGEGAPDPRTAQLDPTEAANAVARLFAEALGGRV